MLGHGLDEQVFGRTFGAVFFEQGQVEFVIVFLGFVGEDG
jgi:hypothetical protein